MFRLPHILTMVPLPDHRPQNLSLGPLEAEILEIIYDLKEVTVKDVHDRILADPDSRTRLRLRHHRDASFNPQGLARL